MSRVAIYEKTLGDEYGMFLRKYIDYFCELSSAPENCSQIETNDKAFANSQYWGKIKWVVGDDNDSYIPSYNDVLRVVSLVEFNRGKLGDLVALLSGRDFAERDYKLDIAADSFRLLEQGVDKFTKKVNFEHFVQDILWNLQYNGLDLGISQNAINYAYAMYLRSKDLGVNDAKLKSLIRRLLVLSLLIQRHSGSFESTWTSDFQRVNHADALEDFVNVLERQNLTDVFWTDTLPSRFDNTIISSPDWILFNLAQKYLGNQGFLTTTLVRDMKTAQVHHIYPKAYLIKHGYTNKNMYNKLANYVYLHDQVNNKISDLAPEAYLGEVAKFNGAYGNEMQSIEELSRNLKENAIPALVENGNANNYMEFLKERQKLMAVKIKEFYSKL